ncbi:MAG: hypothetical protein ACI8Z5_000365 [Lentimonas sp.]|jgi:hypothetical protein
MPNCLIGIGSILYGSYTLITEAVIHPAIGGAFVAIGLLYIRQAALSYHILSIQKKGIELADKHQKWAAKWGKFAIVENGTRSFAIQIEKKAFTFTSASLPPEILAELKARTEARMSRKQRSASSMTLN